MVLPRNSYFAIAQAAQTPSRQFAGPEIAATSSVSLMAATVSGSLSPFRKAGRPALNASMNTTSSGTSRNSARKNIAAPMSTALVVLDSAVGARQPSGGVLTA